MKVNSPRNMSANPKVSMIAWIRVFPIKGRRKNFSSKKPSVKLPANVNANAKIMGRPAQTERARKINAPIAISPPWAKFRTLLDLKIMANPSAERA